VLVVDLDGTMGLIDGEEYVGAARVILVAHAIVLQGKGDVVNVRHFQRHLDNINLSAMSITA